MCKFNGYQFSNILAVAHSAGDSAVQDAVIVRSTTEYGEVIEYIYFGFDLPTTEEDAMQMLKEADYPSAVFCIDDHGIYHEGIYDLSEL